MVKPSSSVRLHNEVFDSAERYERDKVPRMFEPAARLLLSHVPLEPHDRVLDVACGTGIVARLVAEEVGFDGSITGIDIDPNMLAVARTRKPRSGLRIEWREGDAADLPFDPGSFDIVLCQQGMQYFPDKGAALRSMHRVLAPGGRIAILVAASINPGDQPRKWAVMEARRKHVGSEAAEKERHPGYFRGGASLLGKAVREAGFRNVDVKRLLDYWGPTGTLEELIPEENYSNLEPKTRTAVVKDIRKAMQPYDRGIKTQLPVGFYVALGRK